MTGFNSKRDAAADKLHWSDCAVHNGPAYPAGACDCGVAQEPVIPLYLEWELGYPEHVASGTQRQMDRLKKWLDKYFALIQAQPVQEPYDQTALELCNVCGWKTLIPDDGCLNCKRAQPAQREWVGLTVQERNDCLVQADPNECLNDLEAHQLMVEVEAKLKEKNL